MWYRGTALQKLILQHEDLRYHLSHVEVVTIILNTHHLYFMRTHVFLSVCIHACSVESNTLPGIYISHSCFHTRTRIPRTQTHTLTHSHAHAHSLSLTLSLTLSYTHVYIMYSHLGAGAGISNGSQWQHCDALPLWCPTDAVNGIPHFTLFVCLSVCPCVYF